MKPFKGEESMKRDSLGHEKIETTNIYMEKVLETDQNAIHDWDSESFGGYI